MPCGNGYQLGGDTTVPHPCGHNGIKDEGMGPAVPRHVDEPHQLAAPPGTHPAQTVLLHPGLPGNLTSATTETLRVQGTHGRIIEVATPNIRDRHPAIVKATPSARQANSRRRRRRGSQARWQLNRLIGGTDE
jgi:hypothetical protein